MNGVSIALLTYNGEKYLQQLLEMIRRQKVQPDEVLAIDSGSTDSTLQILDRYVVNVHPIAHADFNHSSTRNLAARLCSGRLVVFLTQDATPADACWLECLVRPFEQHSNVAGIFSRQVPRPDASLLEASDIRIEFPLTRFIKNKSAATDYTSKQLWQLIKFSNVSSAYDRRLLLQNPFDERLVMGEDQEWAKRMLEAGYCIVYEPDSVVLHSHDHSLRQKYERSVQMGGSFALFLRAELGRRSILLEGAAWLYHIFLDLLYIASCGGSASVKIKWLSLSPLHRAVIHYAYRKGWNSLRTQLQPRRDLELA